MKKAILAVSFGTSYPDTLQRTIAATEEMLRKTFPDWEVRRAFTSGMIIRKLQKRDGLEIDTVTQAMKRLEAEGYTVPAADAVDFSLLTDETEQALIKQIASYGQVVLLAARDYDPSHINRYLTALAAAFHKFYAACRIKGEEKPVLLARLKLADTTRAVLKNAMTLIGCSAPEKM